jgi:hypothetical protein
MRSQRYRPGLVPGLVLLLAAAGCFGGRPPEPADPDRAREVLRATLDAWQKGESGDSLQQRQPAIIVVDEEWRDGYRLLGYKLGGELPMGGELRCRVALSLKNPRGRAVKKDAVFNVGTGSVLTVSRQDDS